MEPQAFQDDRQPIQKSERVTASTEAKPDGAKRNQTTETEGDTSRKATIESPGSAQNLPGVIATAPQVIVDPKNATPHEGVASGTSSLISTPQVAANSQKPELPAALPASNDAPTEASHPEASAPVQSARIFHNVNQSEMQVGLRTDTFGAVQVRTSISEKQVEVALGSERGDLTGFMTSELPTLQSNLQQHDLRLQHLRTITPAYAAQSDAFSQGGQSRNSRRESSESQVTTLDSADAEAEDVSIESESGLSIRI